MRETAAIPAFTSFLTSDPRSAIALFRENNLSLQPRVLFVIDSLYLVETDWRRDFNDSEKEFKSDGPALSLLTGVVCPAILLFCTLGLYTEPGLFTTREAVTSSAWPTVPCGVFSFTGDSFPMVANRDDGLAEVVGFDSFSPPGEEEYDWIEPALPPEGGVEKTRKWGRPWVPLDLPLAPSRLAMRWVRPIAAAAARCWMIRSSSSASSAPTGKC
jgi:hypothetical protein